MGSAKKEGERVSYPDSEIALGDHIPSFVSMSIQIQIHLYLYNMTS